MSCGNNSPCWKSSNSGCGVDPCYTQKLSTDVIIYGGPTLPCTDIEACTSVTVALQKIDNEICTLSNNLANNLIANNGLYRIGNAIKLGGVLTEPTTITTYPINTLSITGLIHDSSPNCLVSETIDGIVRKTYISDILTYFTADNGVNKSDDFNFQLGGELIKPTEIATDSVNTLSLTGLVHDSNPAYYLSAANDGTIKKSYYYDILNLLTADNGLNKSSNTNVQLGGTLIKNTNIDLDQYSLSISSYNNGANPIVYDIIGKQGSEFVKYHGVRESQDVNAIVTTAINLSKLYVVKSLPVDQNATGAYLANSFLALSGKTTDDTVDAVIGVYVPNSDIEETPSPDPIYNTTSYIRFNEGVSRIYSNYLVVDNPDPSDSNIEKGRVWIKSNTGIGDQPYNPIGWNPVTSIDVQNDKLKVLRTSGFTSSSRTSASNTTLYFVPLSDNENVTSPCNIYSGSNSEISFNLINSGGNIYVNPSHIYSGATSLFIFNTIGNAYGIDGDIDTPTGNYSCHSTFSLFSNTDEDPGGNIDRVIGYRVVAPIGDCNRGYNGIIGEYVGLQIENLQTNIGDVDCSVNIQGDTYAIKQLGNNDVNLFNGKIKMPNLPVYADNTAALGGGLVAGDVYRTSTGVLMVTY